MTILDLVNTPALTATANVTFGEDPLVAATNIISPGSHLDINIDLQTSGAAFLGFGTYNWFIDVFVEEKGSGESMISQSVVVPVVANASQQTYPTQIVHWIVGPAVDDLKVGGFYEVYVKVYMRAGALPTDATVVAGFAELETIHIAD